MLGVGVLRGHGDILSPETIRNIWEGNPGTELSRLPGGSTRPQKQRRAHSRSQGFRPDEVLVVGSTVPSGF